eukprot:Sspe_Gene.81117::Locus_51695_Transcript_1_1_Confidence_1.000_Length_622::g.81117::m.81117
MPKMTYHLTPPRPPSRSSDTPSSSTHVPPHEVPGVVLPLVVVTLGVLLHLRPSSPAPQSSPAVPWAIAAVELAAIVYLLLSVASWRAQAIRAENRADEAERRLHEAEGVIARGQNLLVETSLRARRASSKASTAKEYVKRAGKVVDEAKASLEKAKSDQELLTRIGQMAPVLFSMRGATEVKALQQDLRRAGGSGG